MAVPTVGQKRQRRAAPDFSRGLGGTTTTRRAIAQYAPGVCATTTQCDHCTICAGMWYAQRRRDAYPSSRHCNARRIERGVPLVGTPVRFGVFIVGIRSKSIIGTSSIYKFRAIVGRTAGGCRERLRGHCVAMPTCAARCHVAWRRVVHTHPPTKVGGCV